MIELDVAVVLIAGVVFVGLGLLVVAQLVESARERRANAWHPATTGPTVRLACCAAPDVPDDAAHCIRCGKAVQE